MSEQIEKQNEEAAREQRAFEEEQRRIWTPPSVLERCCLPWLSHGPARVVRRGPDAASVASRGCSGCARAHPRIALDFRDGAATAALSHALDPFARFFDGLAAASGDGPRRYRLAGLLSEHRDALERRFGAHLVSVARRALAASRRACEQELERDDAERAAKRRRIAGEAAPVDLLETALEICCNHALRNHLDVADIAWMRTTCKSMGRVAARLARERMRSLTLSYSTYIPMWDIDGASDRSEMSYPQFQQMSLDATATHPLVLNPREPQRPITIQWGHRPDGTSDVRVEMYLSKTMNATIPERNLLFQSNKDLEVARYLLDSRRIREEGEVHRVRSNVQSRIDAEGTLEYRVAACQLERSVLGDTSTSGVILLRSIAFGFGDFLGVYARLRLHQAKQKYRTSAIKTPADKAYVRALAKMAREAPGNADSFRGMGGWEDVYG